jgi:hypothetical protein
MCHFEPRKEKRMVETHIHIRRKVLAAGVIVLALSILTFIGCSPQFSKLPESQVDRDARANAESLATSILASYEAENYRPLGDEATDAMRLALTVEKQKEAHASVKNVYGAFKSLEYAQTWVNPDKTIYVYRFRGNFEAADKAPEVRVVFDKAGKLAGFWIRPWNDSL